MSPETIGTVYVLTSACLLAISQTIAKAVILRMPFFIFLMLRSIGAVTILIPVTIFLGWKPGHSFTFFAVLALGGFVWPGVVNILSYNALKVLPANVNRPLFQTYPAFAFAMSVPLGLGEFSWVKLVGVLLTTAGGGGFALFNKDAANKSLRLSRGAVGLVLGAAVLQAVGSLVWKYVANTVPGYQTNVLQSLAAIVFFGSLAGVELRGHLSKLAKYSWKDLVIAWFSGMLLFGIGNTLFFTALKYLDPGPAGAIYSINILLTAFVAWISLGEKWTLAQALSAFMVLGGVVILSVSL